MDRGSRRLTHHKGNKIRSQFSAPLIGDGDDGDQVIAGNTLYIKDNGKWLSVALQEVPISGRASSDSGLYDYTITNLTTVRALDCNDTSEAELADVLGQVITDLIALGIFR